MWPITKWVIQNHSRYRIKPLYLSIKGWGKLWTHKLSRARFFDTEEEAHIAMNGDDLKEYHKTDIYYDGRGYPLNEYIIESIRRNMVYTNWNIPVKDTIIHCYNNLYPNTDTNRTVIQVISVAPPPPPEQPPQHRLVDWDRFCSQGGADMGYYNLDCLTVMGKEVVEILRSVIGRLPNWRGVDAKGGAYFKWIPRDSVKNPNERDKLLGIIPLLNQLGWKITVTEPLKSDNKYLIFLLQWDMTPAYAKLVNLLPDTHPLIIADKLEEEGHTDECNRLRTDECNRLYGITFASQSKDEAHKSGTERSLWSAQ